MNLAVAEKASLENVISYTNFTALHLYVCWSVKRQFLTTHSFKENPCHGWKTLAYVIPYIVPSLHFIFMLTQYAEIILFRFIVEKGYPEQNECHLNAYQCLYGCGFHHFGCLFCSGFQPCDIYVNGLGRKLKLEFVILAEI